MAAPTTVPSRDALTAERGNAADDRSRNGIHFIGVAGIHRALAHGCAGDDTNNKRAECADNIRNYRCADNIDARQPRCINVGAGGVDVPAGAGFAEQEVEDDPEDDGDPDAVIQTKRFSIVEHVFERLGRLGIELHDRVCVVVAVYELGNAARNGHCAKGRDKRREFEFCDKQTH